MKIGIYDPYLDDLGGGEKYMMTIAECLAKDHQVCVFWDDQNDLEKIKKRFPLDLKKIKFKKNIFAQKINLRERILETKKYDILIILSDGSIPFVLSKKLFLHLQQPLKLKKKLSLKEKLKLFRVRAFFCNSEYTQSFNQKLLTGKKVKIIYPPVELFCKKISKEKIILHVGRFRVKSVGIINYKKQDILIEVFKKMVDEGEVKNWKFILAASVHQKEEEQFAQLKKMASGYPIEFMVNKTNSELWDFYNRAKIYWHASGYGEDLKKNPEYAEHFGISTVEAMGAGAVPVVINAGGQKEIVDNGKNGFLWDSLEELRQKTKKLINNEQLREKISAEARLKAKIYNKKNFCESIFELINL